MKKGELTTTQIVTLVVLVASFVILLLFYFSFNWNEQTDREVCRNSVLMRGSVPAGEEALPLKCKTQKVCLSSGGKCEGAPEGTSIIKVNDKEEISEEISKQMYDCWYKMGEGEVDYGKNTLFKNNYCVMCSIIYFDEKIKQDYGSIKNKELYGFMSTNNVPGKDISYLKYLYGTDNLEAVRTEANDVVEGDIYEGDLDFSKPYVIVTSLTKDGNWLESLGTTAIGVAVGIVASPFIAASSYIVLGVTGVGGGFLGHVFVNEHGTFLKPILVPYDADEIIDALECKEFSSIY